VVPPLAICSPAWAIPSRYVFFILLLIVFVIFVILRLNIEDHLRTGGLEVSTNGDRHGANCKIAIPLALPYTW
jgi:hypothetical protein